MSMAPPSESAKYLRSASASQPGCEPQSYPRPRAAFAAIPGAAVERAQRSLRKLKPAGNMRTGFAFPTPRPHRVGVVNPPENIQARPLLGGGVLCPGRRLLLLDIVFADDLFGVVVCLGQNQQVHDQIIQFALNID